MMPHDQVRDNLVTQWLRKAADDITLAEYLAAEDAPFPSAIAYHCQQAAEKYLKAVLTWRQRYFPKTHDLEALLNLVEYDEPVLANQLRDIIIMTPYAVETCYPGDYPDTTLDECTVFIKLAQKVQASVCNLLPRLE